MGVKRLACVLLAMREAYARASGVRHEAQVLRLKANLFAALCMTSDRTVGLLNDVRMCVRTVVCLLVLSCSRVMAARLMRSGENACRIDLMAVV